MGRGRGEKGRGETSHWGYDMGLAMIAVVKASSQVLASRRRSKVPWHVFPWPRIQGVGALLSRPRIKAPGLLHGRETRSRGLAQ